MEKFQIQNHLGEVVLDSVTREELNNLIEAKEHSYYEYDATPENDLVMRWAGEQPEGMIVTDNRIFKKIEE